MTKKNASTEGVNKDPESVALQTGIAVGDPGEGSLSQEEINSAVNKYATEDSDREALMELTTGIVLLGFIGLVPCMFLGRPFVAGISWGAGVLTAILWAHSMHRSLQISFGMSEGDAISNLRNHTVRRYLLAVGIIVLLYFLTSQEDRIYCITYVFGIYMMKLSAYLQPFTHGILVRFGISKPYPKARSVEEILAEAKAESEKAHGTDS